MHSTRTELLRQQTADERFGLANRELLADHLCQYRAKLPLVLERQECSGMSGGDGLVVQGGTCDLRKVQKADEVGDSASVLAETLCELVLGRSKLGEVVTEGDGDFDR